MNKNLVKRVVDRSQGRCEAIYPGPYRCMNPADQIHHRLLRKHGARILEAAGDITNLLHLCHPCHKSAHANPARSYDNGLLVQGSVVTALDGSPVYVGPDDTYRALWPKEATA